MTYDPRQEKANADGTTAWLPWIPPFRYLDDEAGFNPQELGISAAGNVPKYLIVHHLGGTQADPMFDTSNQTFEQVNEYHRQLWNFKSSLGYYLGYHYFIGKNGTLHQARAHSDTGAHTIGYNKSSIGIVLAGNFNATMPTEAQIRTFGKLLSGLVDEFEIPKANILPHRKFSATDCYGTNLSDTWARDVYENYSDDDNGNVDKLARLKKLHAEMGEIISSLE